MNSEQIRPVVDAAISQLGVNQDYHSKYAERYTLTLQLVTEHVNLDRSSSIAELGPGPMLQALQDLYCCKAHAYGLLVGTWKEELERLDISASEWNFNDVITSRRTRFDTHVRSH
jgi:hypothetical protein